MTKITDEIKYHILKYTAVMLFLLTFFGILFLGKASATGRENYEENDQIVFYSNNYVKNRSTKTLPVTNAGQKFNFNGPVCYAKYLVGQYVDGSVNKAVYCLYQPKKSPNGDYMWDGNKPISKEISYCTFQGVQNLGQPCWYTPYRTGDVNRDYYVTQMAIHVINGRQGREPSIEGDLIRSRDPAVYDMIYKMVEDAYANNGNIIGDNNFSKTVELKIGPENQNVWVKDTVNGGWRTKGNYEPTLNRSEDRITDVCVDEENSSLPEGFSVVWTGSNQLAPFYIHGTDEAMKKITAATPMKVTLKGFVREYAAWYYNPPVNTNYQPITFCEMGWDSEPIKASVDAKVPVCTLELVKKDSETDDNVPQGGASLEGAQYLVFQKELYQPGDTKDSPSYVKTIETDKNGYGKISDLPLGDYIVAEVHPSEGYLLDSNIYEVNYGGETLEVNQSVPETIIRGDVELIKFGESTDEEETVKRPLKGVKFTFTSKTTGKPVAVITTDQDGFATTKSLGNKRGNLVYDTYIVTESNTPEGFQTIPPFEVKITQEQVTKRYAVENKGIRAAISVIKADSETGRTIPISHTAFKIVDLKTGKDVEMTIHYPKTEKLKVFYTDETGSFMLPEKLPVGEYQLEEIKAPYGYLLGKPLKFRIEKGHNWAEPFTITYKDAPAKGKIIVRKTDSKTKKTIGGTEFEIRALEDIVTPDGTRRVKQGTLVSKITADKHGMAVSDLLYLGRYGVKEVKQNIGYAKDEKVYEVELIYKDQETSVVLGRADIENEPTEFQIHKTGETEEGEEEKPLAGVKFRFWEKEKEIAGDETDSKEDDNKNQEKNTNKKGENTDENPESEKETTDEKDKENIREEKDTRPIFETDKDGNIFFEYLKPGVYCYQEVETAEGYITDNTVYEIEVDENGKIEGEPKKTVYLENKAIKLGLLKVDAHTDEPIKGAAYQLIDKKGNVKYEWKSTGKSFVITGIPVGEYTVHEKEAPVTQGYVAADDFKVQVKEKEDVQKVFMKEKKTRVLFKKVEAETNQFLEGAALQVMDQSGKVIKEWVSTNEATEFSGLEPEREYILREIKAPDGYEKAEDQSFYVRNTEELQEVVLINKRIPEEKPKTVKDIPKTGDGSSPEIYLILSAAFILLISLFLNKNRRI